MDTSDEVELISRLQNNDADAYMLLYKRYHVLVYNWAIAIVKVEHLAEDLVQDVFLKIWQIRNRLNPSQSFPAFIYRIARNKAFTLLKKIANDDKLRADVILHLANKIESAEHKVQWREYEVILQKAVSQLPTQRQKVFKLCRQDGKTYDEVAQELGISRNTVKEHMVMAVKNIKEYLYRFGDVSFLIVFTVERYFKDF
jgi:RNA polymerase sigma-70 factor (ECF subfamily)